ncbi:hypothetical protein [Actinoplanes sp. L3-i22]|uniref:hypothetical protein n=1 Tax=Actinoplanes sp. L3-i22 TaxID=2836373 RepID=UPI001C77A06C|nr:hypothetical protein [Actinoplanes sp. L3-i22]BCY09018.1 hypothetical protein L3i22_041060 [Actinoplanes sp. L3-i22]
MAAQAAARKWWGLIGIAPGSYLAAGLLVLGVVATLLIPAAHPVPELQLSGERA